MKTDATNQKIAWFRKEEGSGPPELNTPAFQPASSLDDWSNDPFSSTLC